MKKFLPALITSFLISLPGILMAEKKITPDKAVSKIVKTIDLEKNLQKKGEKWSREQSSMENSIRNTKLEIAWYEKQISLFKGYVETAEKRVSKLETTKKDMEHIEENLELELKETASKLTAFKNKDLPFLIDERNKRIQFMDDTIKDYGIDSAEKLRRITEALQVELEYSKTMDITSETRIINGENRNVNLIRIGRIALYALSPDENYAWVWKDEKDFIPLNQNQIDTLKKLVFMVENENIRELSILPVSKGAFNEL